MTETLFDVAIVGGGINGIGIARDLAGRGASVYVCEKGDLASGTSSKSTKLIHGGLRYLENYEFSLVREALNEREILMRNAPHIIWPLRFVIPHVPAMRPSWMVRLGLFLYDNLGRRTSLPGSKRINLHQHSAGKPLEIRNKHAYIYSDCWVEDARMTVLNAIDAVERGARLDLRTELTKAKADSNGWTLTVERDGVPEKIQAKSLVNAAGPAVNLILENALDREPRKAIRMVQGSHIVIKKLYDHPYCYFFQNPDGRIFFTIPYEGDFTLIGTTDHEVDSAENPQASEEEIAYLCKGASAYFKTPIQRDDVVWTYAGVRPLYTEADQSDSKASKVSRDYHLEQASNTQAPLLTVYGGKITTFRHLAEDAADIVGDEIGVTKKHWTADAPLPGGDMSDFDAFLEKLQADYPSLPAELALRYARYYGTRSYQMLGHDLPSIQMLGHHFGAGLYEREVEFSMQTEWASCAEDLIWRRSKLGLRMSADEISALDDWMKKQG